ncbi:MAG: hypothetical protein M1822_003865 [Bathelium mastoideum]|nr:MAG: hypothetical protein M1822_003865 [Bathelium mastoideum]
MAPTEADSDDEFYEIPLTDQRIFGAGLKRKRVKFVSSDTATSRSSARDGTSAAERYLATVLPNHANARVAASEEASLTIGRQPSTLPACDICKLPIDATCAAVPHEASLAHQVCLQHSHPPSSLDRERKGLKFLQAYGWDPDSRIGLGASGAEGMLFPLKPKEKRDTAGLAARDGSDDEGKKKKKPVPKVEKLNPKQLRKREMENKRRDQRLADMFYWDQDLEKYLGPG